MRSTTGSTPQTNTIHNRVRETFTIQQTREAMGINWMPMSRLSQAIPPAYSEFIGRQVLSILGERPETPDATPTTAHVANEKQA
jgi:DNA (cytosine-5)-methyltransferase 1